MRRRGRRPAWPARSGAKARENDEERGLETLYLAHGLATWTSDRSSATPNAPVLLYPLTLSPVGASAEDFALQIDDDAREVNQALLHLLETDFSVSIDPEELLGERAEEAPRPTRDAECSTRWTSRGGRPVQPESSGLGAAAARLRDACRPLPGFPAVNSRVVVGNFSYAKLPMVRDLERVAD